LVAALNVQLPNAWQPRWYQRELWDYLENGGKRAVAVCHRRWGKDDVLLHRAAVAAFERVGTYWHMLPEAAQAKKAIWNAVNAKTGKRRIDEAFPQAIRANTNNTEMFIRFKNGSTWQVVGSDNFNSLVGSPPVGVTFSEFSIANPAALAYIDPILIENGGWAAFIYTPRGNNHGLSLLKTAKADPDWFWTVQTAADTGAMSDKQLAAALSTAIGLFEEDAGRAFFEQEYYCSFEAAILGSIYGAFVADADRKGRIGPHVQFDPELPVHTAWDLGFGDLTVIWFWQMVRNEVRLIDYYQNFGKDVPHYTDKLKAFAADKGYAYGKHYVPHDAGRKVLESGGKSTIQLAAAEGVTLTQVVSTTQSNQISAARKTLRHVWINDVNCERGLDALKSYRYIYDEKLKAFRSIPYHDWSSHAADGFEIIAQVWREQVGDVPDDGKPKIRTVTPEMWAKLKKELGRSRNH
jgi:phage terminase large subunit